MRKYIKTMREQFDNNSVIFKEAKKMFHYVPSDNHPYGRGKMQKSKRENTQEFKDDFSSVKYTKNQNNQINESSWIAKLVNGIQDHSLEDLKVPCKEFKGRLSVGNQEKQNKGNQKQLQNLKSQNIVIVTDKQTSPLKEIDARAPVNSECPTKKNSLKYHKNDPRSTQKYSKNKYTKQRQVQKPEKENTQPKVKVKSNQKRMTRNTSQSLLKSDCIGPRKKSSASLNVMKAKEQKKCKSPLNGDSENARSCKFSQKTPTQKKKRKPLIVFNASKLNQSSIEIEQMKFVTQNKNGYFKTEEKKDDSIFHDQSYEPLFDEPYSSKATVGGSRQQSRVGCGSIRKNSKKIEQSKASQGNSHKQESTQVMASPKFSTNSQLNEAIILKSGEDIISPRQQRILVDKYLKSSYPLKDEKQYTSVAPYRKDSSKRYNYEVNGGNHSLHYQSKQSQENKKTYNYNRYQYRSYYESEATDRSKTNYEHQTDRNKPTLTNSHAFSGNHFALTKNSFSTNNKVYDLQASLVPTRSYSTTVNRSQLKGEKKKQQQEVGTKANIHKNAYLQAESTTIDSSNNSNKKPEHDHKVNQNTKPISKYSYLALNSTLKEDNLVSSKYISGEKPTNPSNHEGSEVVMDRLNSKLSLYISQHHLHPQIESDRPEEWNTQEPTHRAMKLTFKQLKKHGEFAKN